MQTWFYVQLDQKILVKSCKLMTLSFELCVIPVGPLIRAAGIINFHGLQMWLLLKGVYPIIFVSNIFPNFHLIQKCIHNLISNCFKTAAEIVILLEFRLLMEGGSY
jgi:hypothetical protein